MTTYEHLNTLVHTFTPKEPAIRPFTDKERSVIDRELKNSGRTLFASQGWKKTGIDDLCRAAGIARGTFYHFYASKEAFFLALLAEAEQAVKQELLEHLASASLDGPATLNALFDTALTVIDRHPLLQFAFADPAEPAPWLRNIDGESLEVLTDSDTETASQVLVLLRQKGLPLSIPAETFAGLLRALVLLPLQKRIVGERVYEAVRQTLSFALAKGLS